MHLISVVRSHGNLRRFFKSCFHKSSQTMTDCLPISVFKLISLSISCLFNNCIYNNLHVALMKCFGDLVIQNLQIIFVSFPWIAIIFFFFYMEKHNLPDSVENQLIGVYFNLAFLTNIHSIACVSFFILFQTYLRYL